MHAIYNKKISVYICKIFAFHYFTNMFREGRTDVRPLHPTPPLHTTDARTRETRAHANVYKRIL